MSKDFVFLDRRGSRWRRVRILALLLVIAAIIGGVVFVRELLIWPDLTLPAGVRDLKTKLRAAEAAGAPSNHTSSWHRLKSKNWQQNISNQRVIKPPDILTLSSTEVRAAIYVSWDPASFRSLKEHKDLVTHVITDWFSLTDMSLRAKESPDNKLLEFLAGKHIALMPRLSNQANEESISDPVEALIRTDSKYQDAFINTLLTSLKQIKASGVVVDWQELDPAYSSQLTALFKRMADRLHNQGMSLWINMPVGEGLGPFDLTALSAFTDHFIAELHGENTSQDAPGPIASQPWFEGWLNNILEHAASEKWIISLGTYGYDWANEGATKLSFADCLSRASQAGLDPLSSTKPDYNPHFSYQTDHDRHTVWFLDASTFLNQLEESRKKGCGGIVIDQLGFEDPSIWQLLEVPPDSLKTIQTLKKLRFLKPGSTLTNFGAGDLIEADIDTAPGLRLFSVDPDDYVCVSYEKYPRYATLYHQGSGKPNQVALTFDDGPSPYTTQILDILAKYQVHATFFLLGKQCEKYPKLVRRIVAEGHTIGSHTYTHRNLDGIPADQIVLELNATQRLLEWLTGKSTILFRPPYNADSAPQDIDDIRPLALAGNMGYLNVCESVDLEDWERSVQADVIFKRLQERRPFGNIVLMHDGGGDRSQTVKALPRIIEYLRARGDDIVSVETLVGIPRDALMPDVKSSSATIPRIVSNIGLLMYQWVEEFVWSFMVLATALLLLRTLIVAVLAYLAKRRQSRQLPSRLNIPEINVVLAVYNEGKVIQETLSGLFRTNYNGKIKVIIVDDGSKDNTVEKITEFARGGYRLSLIRQENQGKAGALQTGLAACTEEIVILLDGDTQFEPQTIPALLAPFANRNVGAVSGHARVGNLRTWIARFQSLEYICGFNLDRRAYDSVDAITVVPGAISAFRIQAIIDAGGISANTLAEDTDLTLSLHRVGWRVAYAPEAFAWTEAPETIVALARQRFRWAFGTLQCLWKHRDMLFNIKYGILGWFALPNIWFFQIILVAAVPVVDALLLISLFVGNGSFLIVYFIAFLVTDFILAALACWLDGEPLKKALYILPMRFLYRPLLSYVVWRSIIHGLKGVWVEWGKLERKGSVQTPQTITI